MFKLLKINDAKEALAKLEADVADKEAIISSQKEELESASDYAQDLKASLAESQIEVASLQQELEEALDNTKKVEQESLKGAEAAAEIVATCGAEEPVKAETKEEVSNDELWAEYHALSSASDKVEFYRKHRNKLLNKE